VGIYTRQSVCTPIRAEEGLLGVLCPPGLSKSYRELPEDECIGGYPTSNQIAEMGLDATALDAEGRCLVLEFPAFVLFGVYSPANSNGLRDDFRYGFICALDARIRNLQKMGKNVILTGDLNVSREEIDTAKAEESRRQDGLSQEEYLNAPNRRIFNQLLENGKVPGQRDEGREQPVLWDLIREFYPKREGMFTHWEQKINARPGNFGSRIDYVLCSIEMKDWFEAANIQEGLMGSDHCPVYATTKDIVSVKGRQIHMIDLMNPPGMFRDGTRIRETNVVKDLLRLSGRLLPEFDKRRSIKDMFTRKPANGSMYPSEAPSLQQSPKQTQSSPDDWTKSTGSTLTAISPKKSAEKRRSTSSPVTKPVKRTKSNGSTDSKAIGKGQQSLKGFFTRKEAPASLDPLEKSDSRSQEDTDSSTRV
jgi:AP endonuclease 2